MKNITIRIQPTSITQTNSAMPKSIYPVVISDGVTTSTALDPLDYLITNIDSIHRFRIYIKNNDGHEKEISLPVHIQKNIIEFIKNHRDSSKWCCQDFTSAAHGLYQRGQQDFHSGQWRLASLSETSLHELKAGDFIGMEGGYTDGHAALYLGEGLYLSKLGYKHGLAICKLEDMKKSYQRLTKFTPAAPIPRVSAPQPITPIHNPNIIIAKKLNDVAIAIIKGISDEFTDLLSLVLHPLDNLVYPMSDLLYDALIIAAVHNEILEPHAVFAMNSPQYLKAATRMAERINGLIEIYNNKGEVFLNAPLEVQVEQLSRLMTNLLLPGKVFQGFQTVYAGAKNFKTLGVFKNPPLFLNTRPEGLSPNLKWSPLTKEQLKSIKDTTECIYVITEDRQLIMAPKLLEKPVLNAEGTRTITEIHHHELSKLCPVIAAGELEVVNGTIRSINNMSGRYLPSGPHLQTIVEKVFNNEGYVIRGKYQESVWVQHYSSEHAIVQRAAPLATTKLNPFVQLTRFISATTKDTDLKSSVPNDKPAIVTPIYKEHYATSSLILKQAQEAQQKLLEAIDRVKKAEELRKITVQKHEEAMASVRRCEGELKQAEDALKKHQSMQQQMRAEKEKQLALATKEAAAKRTAYELAKRQRDQEIQSQLKLLPTQLTSSSSFTDAIRAIRNLRNNTDLKQDGQWSEYGRQKEAFDDYLFNKYQRRLPILPLIVEANPTVNTADEFYSLAQKYIAEGNQEHFSIDCLHAAITLNPNHGNALCLLGIIETCRLFGSPYRNKNDGFVHLKNARDKGHSLASALMSKLEAAEHRIRLRGTDELYEVGRIVGNKHPEIIESDTSISSSNGNQYQSLYFFSKPRSETTHHDHDRDYDKRNDASQSNTSRGGAQSRGTGYDQCFYRSSDSRGDLYKCGTRDAMLSGTFLDNNRTLTVRDVDGREIYHSTVSASRNGSGFVSYSDTNHGDTTVMHVRDVERSGNGFDTGNPSGDAVDQAMARR